MRRAEAIIKPIKGKNTPDPGSLNLLICTASDIKLLRQQAASFPLKTHRLFISKFYSYLENNKRLAMAGPIIGAPYAVMVLETLIAWGARRFIFWGWCGAISSEVAIGDIIVPTAAYVDEGTSLHYGVQSGSFSHADNQLTTIISAALKNCGADFHHGPVWSTDAIFRETKEKVISHQSNGILAVEMELSALFSVATYRQVEIGGILVVSDELASLQWRPGFKDERFRQARFKLCEVVKQICQNA